MTGTGLQCHVSEDGTVEVAIAGQNLKLSESQLARSPVLNSIADKPGVGLLPVSEEAFKHWHAHVEPASRKSVQVAKAVLQASIFLQDSQAATSASLSIAHRIRKAIRPSFVDFDQSEGMLFPKQANLTLPNEASLKDLAAQVADLQQIEAAEIAGHLSAVEVIVFAKSCKNSAFLDSGELKSTMDVRRELQFATPKFVHAFFEACGSPVGAGSSMADALQELHLPARCFTDSNINPIEPVQGHIPKLHTLSVMPSSFLKPSLRNLKDPFASFLSNVAQMSTLKQIRFGIPNLPTKTARATDSARLKKIVRSLQSLSSLTALHLAVPVSALDYRQALLSSFPALVHLYLQPSGLSGRQMVQQLHQYLLQLPTTMQSIHLNVGGTSDFTTSGALLHWQGLAQLLHTLACPEPLYPHLTYLVFQGTYHFASNRDDWCLQTFDASWTSEGTVQADVGLRLCNCDAVRTSGLSEPLHITLPHSDPPSTSQGAQHLDLQLRVVSLQLSRNTSVDIDGLWDDYLDHDTEVEQAQFGGYLEQLMQAAIKDEQSYAAAGQGRAGQVHVRLVGESALQELKVGKAFMDNSGHQSTLPDGRYRPRIVEQRRKRAEFFQQYVDLRRTRLVRLQYTLAHYVNDQCGSQPTFAKIQRSIEIDDAQTLAEHWETQTRTRASHTKAAAADNAEGETGPGTLKHLRIDIEGFADSLPLDLKVLRILCGGSFTGLQHLDIFSPQPVSWAPDAVHRSFAPALQQLSVLTTLKYLTIQRVPGVCVLVECLSNSLSALETLSLHGVEHDGDAMLELGSYLGAFTRLQRLDLSVLPLFGARRAIGAAGRCMLASSAYGSYRRGRSSNRTSASSIECEEEADADSLEEEDDEYDSGEDNSGVLRRAADETVQAREVAEMCGCDVEDLLESDDDEGADKDNTPNPRHMKLRERFWRSLWNGISALPLLDGIEVYVANAELGDGVCVDPRQILT